MLHDATADWQDKFPDVVVIHTVIGRNNPVRALNDATDTTDLVVVGARGLGGFPALAIGSVSDGLVRYAQRQVAIARTAGDPS
jgi:nucleotide-binding universal stress UspA family protein